MNSDATINELANAIKGQTRVIVFLGVLVFILIVVVAWDLYEIRKEAKFDADRYLPR